ncbi:DNA replication complex GINS protein Sld5 [Ceratobasidium theobromae]|uniref:DNA replication complex GINS protein SLD5 n=1 Tax=Ceratobasidium theobromae TaxID=1582974 RepID=A0A5N5QF76_9AGAM|nr:DNA replication complex GINS protein Sld5 [Ceratobasidium theobromae]
MATWDDIPPRVDAAMEREGDTVDTTEVLGSNPDNPTHRLMRALMNERYAPELLPWEGQLIEDNQMVEYLRSDDATSEDEHFRMSYVQLDMERIKFQIRSYVRTRLHKIEKYASYIMAHPELQSRMSVLEQNHAISTHASNRTRQPSRELAVLDRDIPRWEVHGQVDLYPVTLLLTSIVPVSEPNLTQGVFIYAIDDCGPVRLPDGDTVNVEKGSIHIFQYATIKHLIERGDAMFI